MILYPILFAASLLSVIGCILNILFTVFLKKTHNYPLGKMVIHLSIFDLLYAVSFDALQELNIKSQTNIYLYQCLVFLMNFGNSGSVLMASCFALCLYRIGEEGNDNFLQLQYKLYTKICYVFALVAALFTVGLHCLYLVARDPDDNRNLSELLIIEDIFWIIQIAISFIVSLLYYIRAFKLVHLRRISIPWVLLVYPTILLICNIPFCLVSFLQSSNVIVAQYSLRFELIDSLWMLQGFLNALVYGLTSGVREAIKEQCCKNDADETLCESRIEEAYYQCSTDNVVNSNMIQKSFTY